MSKVAASVFWPKNCEFYEHGVFPLFGKVFIGKAFLERFRRFTARLQISIMDYLYLHGFCPCAITVLCFTTSSEPPCYFCFAQLHRLRFFNSTVPLRIMWSPLFCTSNVFSLFDSSCFSNQFCCGLSSYFVSSVTVFEGHEPFWEIRSVPERALLAFREGGLFYLCLFSSMPFDRRVRFSSPKKSVFTF